VKLVDTLLADVLCMNFSSSSCKPPDSGSLRIVHRPITTRSHRSKLQSFLSSIFEIFPLFYCYIDRNRWFKSAACLYIGYVCWRGEARKMRFGLLTAMKMSMVVFWVVTSCGLVGGCQRFGGTYCLHLQGWRLLSKKPAEYHGKTCTLELTVCRMSL
jgi:hypothetical protein